MTECAECKRRMRPRGSDPLLYPGMVTPMASGMCTSCYLRSTRDAAKAKRRAPQAVLRPPAPLTPDEVRVDAMVPRFNRLLKDRKVVRSVLGLDRCDT